MDCPHRTVSFQNRSRYAGFLRKTSVKNFLLEIERRVSADSVIVIGQIEYEVDYRFARQRIRLRYSPDMKEIFIVETDGTLTPIRLLNKAENALIKREKVRLCKGDE